MPPPLFLSFFFLLSLGERGKHRVDTFTRMDRSSFEGKGKERNERRTSNRGLLRTIANRPSPIYLSAKFGKRARELMHSRRIVNAAERLRRCG